MCSKGSHIFSFSIKLLSKISWIKYTSGIALKKKKNYKQKKTVTQYFITMLIMALGLNDITHKGIFQ